MFSHSNTASQPTYCVVPQPKVTDTAPPWLDVVKQKLNRTESTRELSLRGVEIARQGAASARHLSDEQLVDAFTQIRAEGAEVRNRYTGTGNSIPAAEAFRIFCKAAGLGADAVRRCMGFEMHDVQIQGAIATAIGAIIEMQTGEGKTVVSGLAAILRTALDPSVHVATTTDYLAERDHEGVAPIFERLGLDSSVLRQESNLEQSQAAYKMAIVYGPGYLFGFDYLRDQMAIRAAEETTLGRDVLESMNGTGLRDRLAQSEHYCIIVDEADSVLIDEATTPLVLSGNSDVPEPTDAFSKALEVAQGLDLDIDYECDLQKRKVQLLPDGEEKIYEALRGFRGIELARPWSQYIEHALYAEYLLLRDEHYVVRDGGISLVDQFTGRIFDDRMLRGGLHQAVEAKEGLEINPPNRSIARITRQRFLPIVRNCMWNDRNRGRFRAGTGIVLSRRCCAFRTTPSK